MASMTCQCGTVKIQFTSTAPRISTECCCNHCTERVQYLHTTLGGPTVPSKPLLASKWDNRVQIKSGREDLFAYKLTKDTLVTNIASKCCHTFLLGRHAVYDANCVTTSSDFPIFSGAEDMLQPSSRWFANQWDKKRLEPYDKLVGIWVNEDDGSITGEDGYEQVLEDHMVCMNREISPSDALIGETFEELLDTIGNIRIIVDK